MKKELTCIICPIGCQLTAEKNGDEIKVSGNTCPRGEKYAKDELICPKRTVTTTVKCSDGSVLPVKTKAPIPKEKMKECMEIINRATALLPIKLGDVIIKDVFGTDIVATTEKLTQEV